MARASRICEISATRPASGGRSPARPTRASTVSPQSSTPFDPSCSATTPPEAIFEFPIASLARCWRPKPPVAQHGMCVRRRGHAPRIKWRELPIAQAPVSSDLTRSARAGAPVALAALQIPGRPRVLLHARGAAVAGAPLATDHYPVRVLHRLLCLHFRAVPRVVEDLGARKEHPAGACHAALFGQVRR